MSTLLDILMVYLGAHLDGDDAPRITLSSSPKGQCMLKQAKIRQSKSDFDSVLKPKTCFEDFFKGLSREIPHNFRKE